MDDRKQNGEYAGLSEDFLAESIGEKSSLSIVSSEQHSPHGTSFPTDSAANCAAQPTTLSCENTSHGGGKSSSSGKENPQNLIPATSIGDLHLQELLEQLIKPDVSCSAADGGSSETVKSVEEGLVLLSKQVPVSDFRSMVSVANGAFTCLRGLCINYSSLYERVRNYIRCCYLLTSTEQFKQASSVEELAVQYDSGKEYNEVVHRGMKKLSTDISEVLTTVSDRVSYVEKSLVKFETEHLVCGTEHNSGTLREVLEKLKRLQDAVRDDLEPRPKTKNQCYFEEIWEGFVNAKAALGL